MKDNKAEQLIFTGIPEFVEQSARRAQSAAAEPPEAPLGYRLTIGRESIQLDIVEFRILTFLASRPYHPFTRRRIAEAISTDQYPVTEDQVDHYVHSLRAQLAIFRDYVQTVPYIGYRFKA